MSWENNLHPELIKRVKRLQLIAKDAGFDLRVVSAFRSHAAQNKLYAQGRTTKGKRVTNARGGQSWHNFGLAVDLAPFIDGAICWDERKFDWSLIGKWAALAGLEWGGNWKTFKDRPHVQLVADLSTKEAQQLYLSKNSFVPVWDYISRKSTPESRVAAELEDETADDLAKVETIIATPDLEKPEETAKVAEIVPENIVAEVPAENVQTTSTLETVEKFGDKIQTYSEKVTTISSNISPISRSSWFMTALTKIGGWFLLALGFFQENWLLLLIAFGLIALAIWYFTRAKDRSLERAKLVGGEKT